VIVGNRAKIDIPHLGLCGLTVFTQGADFGGAGGCPTPPVTFTDTYSIRL
jgi:hypothetical protein